MKNKTKRILITVIILLLFSFLCSTHASGRVTKKCYCSYDNSSKEYYLSVTFLSGGELNQATGFFSKYKMNELYACIWFGEDQYVIVTGLVYHSVGATTFDERKFNEYVNGKILRGYDKSGRPWVISVPQVAKMNAKNDFDDTPLHSAAFFGDTGTAKLLIDNGADVNAKEKYGDTPLHVAAFWGKIDVAKLLIDNGADVNAKNEWGDTPLHVAVKRGKIDVAKLLISKGANVNAQNKWGMTPLKRAIKGGHKETADLLRKHGAKE